MCAAVNLLRSSSTLRVDDQKTYVPLLGTENGFAVLIQSGVTSINFFPADNVSFVVSVQKLKDRLQMICEANPWLVGNIVKDKRRHERLMCAFPNTIKDEDIEAIFSTQAPGDVLEKTSSSSTYEEVSKAMKKSGALCKSGYALVNKPDRVCKVSLFPINGGKEFALVLSLAHAIVDGHTYFKVLNMFVEGSTIEPLKIERLENYEDVLARCIGKEGKELLESGYFIGNSVVRKVFDSPISKASANYIDAGKIAKAKQEAKKEHSEDPNFFVSTHDIITSAYGKASDCDTVLMTCNLRGRTKELDKRHAGNYWTFISYDRDSYDRPEKIRKSLHHGSPVKPVSGKGPRSRWHKSTMSFCGIASWAFPFFEADVHLWKDNGSVSAPVALHLPLFEASELLPVSSAYVFKPCKGRLALLCLHQANNDVYKRLQASGVILGETVNADMFQP